MDLKHFEAFLKIVEQGSFTEAANSLFISQSTISNRIKRFEQRLNAHLFERNNGNGAKLTEQGEKIYPVVKRAFDLIDSIPNVLHHTAESENRFSVFCPVHMADHIIPHLFKVLYNTFPNCIFSFNIGNSRKIMEDIREGKIDVGFVYSESPISGKGFRNHHITNEPTLLVASPDHPSVGKSLAISDLKNERIIIYHKALLTYVLLKNFFAENGGENIQIIEIQNFHLIKKMVLEEKCLAFLQRVTVQEDLANGSLVQFNLRPLLPHTPIHALARNKVPPYILNTILETAKFIFNAP